MIISRPCLTLQLPENVSRRQIYRLDDGPASFRRPRRYHQVKGGKNQSDNDDSGPPPTASNKLFIQI
jgi:hypothetical protein